MATSTRTPMRRGYSAPEIAETWGVSKQHVYDLIHAGEIRAFKVGSRLVIPASEIERIEAQAVAL